MSPTNDSSDEVKRKFREALERKKGQQSSRQQGGAGHGKVDHAQGSQAHSKMFRRKSGG